MIAPANVSKSFRDTFGYEPEVFVSAPGRVNLIGEHIDYAGGWVLPAALQRGITVAAGKGEPGRVRVHSSKYLDAGVAEFDPKKAPPQAYTRFVHALALETECAGADILVMSDLPLEKGWSSSAAFSVSVASAMLALNDELVKPNGETLCAMCQRAETEALGVACGLMDQYAAVFGKRGSALWFDTYKLHYEYVPIEIENMALVLVDSNQPRRLAESGYNKRVYEHKVALDELRQRLGDFLSLRDIEHNKVLDELNHLSDTSAARIRHIITEHQRVEKFVEMLKKKDMIQLGQLLAASQHSLSQDYEVSTPELDLLCDMLTSTPGVYGARLVGGGFGGSVLALADEGCLGDEIEETLLRFDLEVELQASWDQIHPGPGATISWPDKEIMPLRDWLA